MTNISKWLVHNSPIQAICVDWFASKLNGVAEDGRNTLFSKDSLGGGLCQRSTRLFNSCLQK